MEDSVRIYTIHVFLNTCVYLIYKQILRHSVGPLLSVNPLHTTDRVVSSSTCKDTCSVDYILYSESPTARAKDPQKPEMASPTLELRLLSHWSLLTPPEFTATAGHVPNYFYASDHIPLYAVFEARLLNQT